jgi:hypothetical protein
MSIYLTDNENHIEMPDAEEKVDKYGNPVDGDRIIYCCFPDCGCDGARLCMAENEANSCACALNIEKKRSKGKEPVCPFI